LGFAAILRQSTAVNVIIGPFVDSANGDDEETGLTIAQADVRLSKNAGADAQKNDNTSCAHEGDGFYMCELDATDTNTVGQLTLWVHVAGALAVRHDYQIVEEAVYDALFAGSALGYVANAPVNVAQFGGTNGTFSSGRPEVNTTHAAGTAWGSGAITAASIASDAITAAKIATGAIDADAIADNAIDAGAIADNAITAAKIANGAIDAATFAADVDAEILSYLVDDATRIDASALNTATGTSIPAILTDTGTTLDGKIDTIDTVVDAIKAVTDALPDAGALTSIATASALATVDTVVDAIKVETDKLADTLEDQGGGTYGFTEAALQEAPSAGGGTDWDADERTAIRSILGIPATGTTPDDPTTGILDTIRDAVGVVDGVVDAILVDTGTTLDGKIDTIDGNVDDILADTADMQPKLGTPAGASISADIADVEGKVDDLESRLGTPINLGSGATVAANLVDIEGQTDDIGAAGAGLTAIPWNASWDTEVESEVADALEATIADSIPNDGTRPSVKQALYMLTQFMLERNVSSTTVTVNKPDGTTQLFTLTLNDDTSPTSITRAS
jgi:hypothetical protein